LVKDTLWKRVGVKVYSRDNDNCILCDVDNDNNEDVDFDADDAELLITKTTEDRIGRRPGVR